MAVRSCHLNKSTASSYARHKSSRIPRQGTVIAAASHPTGQSMAPWQALAVNVAAAALIVNVAVASPALAVGMESVELPPLPDMGQAWASIADAQKNKIAEADDTFAKSDTLKRLLEQSAANKAKNKKEIQEKYCYRQAELGIGDCGGLRYIPGMTQNGKQKTPQWMADLLGVEVPDSVPEGTLKGLFDSKGFDQ